MFEMNTDDFSNQCRLLMSQYTTLPKSLHRKHMRAAMRRVAAAFVKPLRGRLSLTTRGSGSLSKSVTTLTGAYPWAEGGAVWARVTYARPRKTGKLKNKKGKAIPDGSHGLWLEHGTKARFRVKANKYNQGYCGIMPAENTMGTAFTDSKAYVSTMLERELFRALQSATREMNSKKWQAKRRR